MKPIERGVLQGGAVGALLIVAIAFSAWTTAQIAKNAAVRKQSSLILRGLAESWYTLREAETLMVEHLLSGSERFLTEYNVAVETYASRVSELRQLTAGRPEQQAYLDEMERLAAQKFEALGEAGKLQSTQGLQSAMARINSEFHDDVTERLRVVVLKFRAAEDSYYIQTDSRFRSSTQRLIWTVSAAGILAVLLVILFAYQAQREARWKLENEEKSRAAAERFATALAKETALLGSILETAMDSIIVIDERGQVQSFNRAAEQIFGYSAAEVIGRNVNLLMPPPHSEEHDGYLHRYLQTGKAHIIGIGREVDALRKDGSLFPADLSISEVQVEGGRYFAGILRDITSRKKAEADLRRSRAVFMNLFDSLPGVFSVLTPDLRYVAVSQQFLDATMTTRDQIIGRGLFDVFPVDPNDPTSAAAADLRASFDRVRKTPAADTLPVIRYDIRRPDGTFESRFWTTTNTPLLGEDGEIEYIINRAEDVTEYMRQKSGLAHESTQSVISVDRMEAEVFRTSREVKAANEQLHAANSELDAFSYSVSHDLRAPLRHIEGYGEMLAKALGGQLPEKAQRYLNTILESSREMGLLIDDLLAFSRVGRSDLHQAEVSLDGVVSGALRNLESATQGRNIVWKIAPLPGVMGDAAMLKQVFANLLGNAVKYSRGRDPAEIEVGCAGHEDGRAILFVRDNGAGFDMQYTHKLFGVFQRLHRAEDFEGTGIGLAIVKRLVARHGGRVWAEAAPGKGATFYFTLEPSQPKTAAIKTEER